VGRVHGRTATDPAVLLAFYRVVHMLDRPVALFRPAIVGRVLLPRRRRRPALTPIAPEARAAG
jgi:hypothetical protein